MKIVIQCAGSKKSCAGNLTDQHGHRLVFVAHPEAPDLDHSDGHYCRPDELADMGSGSWRDALVRYNEVFVREGSNPKSLLPAGRLYEPAIYESLVSHFQPANVFILSAGWGLVRADFLLPQYNITFSRQQNVRKEYRRGKREPGWNDFNQLRGVVVDAEEVHFLGGRDYLDLFYSLSAPEVGRGKFVIHHKAALRHRDGYHYDHRDT